MGHMIYRVGAPIMTELLLLMHLCVHKGGTLVLTTSFSLG